MKIFFLFFAIIFSFNSIGIMREGLYRGVDTQNGWTPCEIEIVDINHNGLRPSRVNREIKAKIQNIRFNLRYFERFDFQTGQLHFDPTVLRDVIQVRYSLMAVELYMDPVYNYTEPSHFRYVDSFGMVRGCQNLTFVKW